MLKETEHAAKLDLAQRFNQRTVVLITWTRRKQTTRQREVAFSTVSGIALEKVKMQSNRPGERVHSGSAVSRIRYRFRFQK